MTRRCALAIMFALWITLPLVAQKTPSQYDRQLRRIEQALDREIPIGANGQVRGGLETLLEPVEDLLHFDSRIKPVLRQKTLTVKPGERTVRQILDRLRMDHKIYAVSTLGRFVLTNWQGANALPKKLPRPGPLATKKVLDLHQFLSNLGPNGGLPTVQLKVREINLEQCTELILDMLNIEDRVHLTFPPKLAKQIISYEIENAPILETLTLLAWQADGKLRYGPDGLEVITNDDARTH